MVFREFYLAPQRTYSMVLQNVESFVVETRSGIYVENLVSCASVSSRRHWSYTGYEAAAIYPVRYLCCCGPCMEVLLLVSCPANAMKSIFKLSRNYQARAIAGLCTSSKARFGISEQRIGCSQELLDKEAQRADGNRQNCQEGKCPNS